MGKISRLSEQAWTELNEEWIIDGYEHQETFSVDEVAAFEFKFANLILKECIEIVDHQILDSYGDLLKPSVLIKNHFGVKE